MFTVKFNEFFILINIIINILLLLRFNNICHFIDSNYLFFVNFDIYFLFNIIIKLILFELKSFKTF